jgi:transglutaminase-like putative cysteine protease
VFDSGAWFGATLLTVIAVVSAGAVATWLRAPVFLVPLIQAVVMFAALVSRFVLDAPLGFVPSSDALDQLRAVLSDGVHDVDTFAPPIPVTEGDTAVTALGLGCLAIVVFVLQVSLRLPVLAGLSLLAVYIVPSLVLDDGAPWWSFAFVAIGFMVLLVSDERVGLASWGRMLRRAEGNAGSPLAGFSSAALRLGAIAVVAAVAIPVLVPALTDAVLGRHDTGIGNGTDGASGSGQGSIGLDPFVSLRKQLRSSDNPVVFTYTTDAQVPDYLPTVVLTSYDKETWRPAQFSPDNADPLEKLQVDPAIGTAFLGSPKTSTKIVDAGLDTRWLPVPLHLTELTVSGGSWFIDPGTRTIFAENASTSTKGLTWTATSLAVQPSPDQLRAAPPENGTDPTEKARRAGIPERIATIAREQTAGKATDYDKAVALVDYFKDFTYSVSTQSDDNPQAPSYLDQFIDSKTGYCQQFAATMALMAESLGIRARVVVGFTSGTLEDGRRVVRSHDAHAWPELFFSGVGWQRFEPTPPSAGGSVAASPLGQGDTPVVTASPSASASSSVSVKPIDAERDPGSTAPFDLVTGAAGTTADQWRARGLLVLVIVGALLALVPAVWRAVRRRRRLSEQAEVEDMWEELRDTARDLGIPWSMAQTPRQAVSSVVAGQRLRGEAADAARRVGRATEQARYAATPPSTAGLADDVSTVRTALLRRAERKARWKALLLPVSLRDRD